MKNPLSSIFSRRKPKPAPEQAPALTAWQREAFRLPGAVHQLPPHTVQEMMKDGMVQTALTIKRQAVLAAPWKLIPAADTPEARRQADWAEQALAAMEGSPLTILSQAMDAFAHGWSVQELIWRLAGEEVILEAVRAKDPTHFGLEFDRFGKLEGLSLRVPGEEERSLPIGKFVVWGHRRSFLQPKGQSDLVGVHRHWTSKQKLLNAWQLHLERFAMPTVLGSYTRGLPASEQESILDALQNLSQTTAIVHPSEIEISTLGGTKEPSTGFLEAIEFHNREIARGILGQTLATDEGRRVGSLALGRVHLQVLLLQVAALRRELADSVMTEQVLRPLIELNFGPVAPPRFQFEEPGLDVFATGRLE